MSLLEAHLACLGALIPAPGLLKFQARRSAEPVGCFVQHCRWYRKNPLMWQTPLAHLDSDEQSAAQQQKLSQKSNWKK